LLRANWFYWGLVLIIKDGSAQDIQNWFITECTQEIILCVFLGTSKDDVSLLSNLIDQVTHIDGIAGKKIGFLLCANGLEPTPFAASRGGTVNFIGGEYKCAVGNSVSARNFLSSFDLDRLQRRDDASSQLTYKLACEALARSSARLVPEFMEIYGISDQELPCFITLVKGVDTVNVTQCPSDLSPAAVLIWLANLRQIIDQVERDLLMKDFCATEMLQRIHAAKACQQEADAKLEKIKQAALGISRKYSNSLERSAPLILALASGKLNRDQKLKAIESYKADHPESKMDNRWDKISRLQERIDNLRESELLALDRSSLRSLSEKLEDELEKLKNIHSAIARLKMPNSSSRFAVSPAEPRISGRAWEAVGRVNTVSDMSAKIAKAISFIASLITAGGGGN
tara:strand:- start:309 stop:1508 length:1200 start_codon:yes stop_codon:yes gene_type:complete